MKQGTLIAVLVGSAMASAATAQSLTTLFAANNGGSNGGAVYFDISVGVNPVTILGFRTNTAETVTFGWEVFLTDPGGTHVGNHATPGHWTSVATGTGVGNGRDNPSPVTLDNTFTLEANTIYGMALVMGSSAGHDYTNGNGSNQSYGNTDISLRIGEASNVPFTGNPFTPRVWDGTIFYDVVPAPPSFLLIGFSGFVATRRHR